MHCVDTKIGSGKEEKWQEKNEAYTESEVQRLLRGSRLHYSTNTTYLTGTTGTDDAAMGADMGVTVAIEVLHRALQQG
jgi:hypothetical protein